MKRRDLLSAEILLRDAWIPLHPYLIPLAILTTPPPLTVAYPPSPLGELITREHQRFRRGGVRIAKRVYTYPGKYLPPPCYCDKNYRYGIARRTIEEPPDHA